MDQPAEKRKHKRIVCRSPVVCSKKEKSFKKLVYNVSSGGVFMGGKENLPVGQQVSLTIPLQTENKISVNGKVVRSDSNGVAVKFELKNRNDDENLGKFINKIKVTYL